MEKNSSKTKQKPPFPMIKGDFNTTFIVYKTDQVYKKIIKI